MKRIENIEKFKTQKRINVFMFWNLRNIYVWAFGQAYGDEFVILHKYQSGIMHNHWNEQVSFDTINPVITMFELTEDEFLTHVVMENV